MITKSIRCDRCAATSQLPTLRGWFRIRVDRVGIGETIREREIHLCPGCLPCPATADENPREGA